jgi:hypothetical protein
MKIRVLAFFVAGNRVDQEAGLFFLRLAMARSRKKPIRNQNKIVVRYVNQAGTRCTSPLLSNIQAGQLIEYNKILSRSKPLTFIRQMTAANTVNQKENFLSTLHILLKQS